MAYDNASSSPYWYYYPSLSVNSSGVMVVGFSGSNSTEYVGAFYTGRMADGTMLARPVLIQAGRSHYSTISWSDSSYTTLDPSDPQSAIWTVQSYTDIDPAIPGSPIWASWITSMKPGP